MHQAQAGHQLGQFGHPQPPIDVKDEGASQRKPPGNRAPMQMAYGSGGAPRDDRQFAQQAMPSGSHFNQKHQEKNGDNQMRQGQVKMMAHKPGPGQMPPRPMPHQMNLGGRPQMQPQFQGGPVPQLWNPANNQPIQKMPDGNQQNKPDETESTNRQSMASSKRQPGDPRAVKYGTQPSGIDKFNSSVIDQVMKEVAADINHRNQSGQAFGAEPDLSHAGYDASFDLDNHGSAQNNMIDHDGLIIGDSNAVKVFMNDFKQTWKANLKKHCEDATQTAQQRQHVHLGNYSRYQQNRHHYGQMPPMQMPYQQQQPMAGYQPHTVPNQVKVEEPRVELGVKRPAEGEIEQDAVKRPRLEVKQADDALKQQQEAEQDKSEGAAGVQTKQEDEAEQKPASDNSDDDEDDDGIFGADTKPVKTELKKEEPIKQAVVEQKPETPVPASTGQMPPQYIATGFPVQPDLYQPQMPGQQPSYYNEADENEPLNTNTIVAQYKTENRVKSRFKFTLHNAVVFIDGVHYFIKELKAQFEY